MKNAMVQFRIHLKIVHLMYSCIMGKNTNVWAHLNSCSSQSPMLHSAEGMCSLLASAKYFSTSSVTHSGKRVEKSANSRLDEQCQVFDSDDLLVGHMTVRAAEQLAQKEDLKLLDLGMNADNLRSFKLMSGKELAQENKRQKNEKKGEQEKVKEKELRVMTKISDHDLDTKVKQAKDILTKGGFVKFIIKAQKHGAKEDSDKNINQLLKKITSQLKDCAVVKHGTKNNEEQQLLLRPISLKESESGVHKEL